MLIFLVLGTTIGIFLGLHFGISIFAPTILVTSAVVILGGTTGRHEPRVIALLLLGTLISLQIGYLAGGILRVIAPRQRASSFRPTVDFRARHQDPVQTVPKLSAGV